MGQHHQQSGALACVDQRYFIGHSGRHDLLSGERNHSLMCLHPWKRVAQYHTVLLFHGAALLRYGWFNILPAGSLCDDSYTTI